MAFLIPLAIAGSSLAGAGGLSYYIWGVSKVQPDLAKRAEMVNTDLVKAEDVKKLCDEIKQEKTLKHTQTKVEDHQLSRDLLLREIKTAIQDSQSPQNPQSLEETHGAGSETPSARHAAEPKKAKAKADAKPGEQKEKVNLGSIVSTVILSRGRQMLKRFNAPVKTPAENPISKMWLDAKAKLKNVKPAPAAPVQNPIAPTGVSLPPDEKKAQTAA